MSGGRRFPCSYAQLGMWLTDRLAAGGRNTTATFLGTRIRGLIDRDAIQRAVDQVVERHESLRTVFEEVDGEPVQVIVERMPVPVAAGDLRHLPAADRERAAHEVADATTRTPFDLDRGPLVRAVLIRLADDEAVLATLWHHIVVDGWSLRVVIGELCEHYLVATGQLPAPSAAGPVPRLRYADHAVRQRDLVAAGAFDDDLAGWRDRLAGPRPDAVVPCVPGPPGGEPHGAKLRFTVAAATLRGLRSAVRGATPFHLLMSSFLALVSRTADVADVTVGAISAGRSRVDLHRVVGNFVNLLPIRAAVTPQTTCRSLVAAVRSTTLWALARQHVPFELFGPGGDGPPVRYACVMQPGEHLPGGAGTAFVNWPHDIDDVAFELTLVAWPEGDGIGGALEYRTDLFDRATAERLLDQLTVLMAAMAAEPDRPVAHLPLVDPAEHGHLMARWNPPALPPAPRPVLDAIGAHVAATPDAEALVGADGRVVTYAELGHRVAGVASALLAAGVAPGEVVGVHLPRGPESTIAVLGVLAARAAYLPLSTEVPTAYVDARLTAAAVRLVLVDRPAPDLGDRVTIDVTGVVDRPAVPLADLPRPAADDLAYVIYTSGSTGRPKGVGVTHGALANTARAWQEAFGLDARPPRVLQAADLAFDVYTSDVARALCGGGTLVTCPKQTVLDPAALADLLAARAITVVELVPAVATLLAAELRTRPRPLDRLELLIVGSDQLYLTDYLDLVAVTAATTTVVNSYGVTEAAIDSTFFAGPVTWAAPAGAPTPIGRAMPGMRAYVLDAGGNPCPVGVRGELHVGGPGVGTGYLDAPEATADRFGPDPFLPGGRRYRTGDVARYLPGGDIELLGRADHQVKIRGRRIEPGEVEAAVRESPEVANCVVTAWGERPGDRRLVAYVALHPGESGEPGEPDLSWLRRRLAARLPEYLVPSAFVVLPALPLGGSGKVDRAALPPPGAPADTGPAYVAPAGVIEETLAELCSKLLGVDRVGSGDGFVTGGGHSLLAARLVAAVRARFGIALPLRAVFDCPTLADLAAAVERARIDQPAAPAIPRRGPAAPPAPLATAQRRMWFLEQLDPGTAMFTVPEIVRLRGPLDVAALERAWSAVVARHEALRTTIDAGGDEPVQRVAAPGPVRLPVVDLGHIEPADRERAVRELARADVARPVDTATGPPWRIRLVRLAADDHVLVLLVHHGCGDDWSSRLVFADLADAYAGRSLPAPAVTYRDVACWQRTRRSPPEEARLVGYWRETLAGAPAVLDLPLDRPRPPVQRPAGGDLVGSLAAPVAAGLARLAATERATTFMALLAGYAALLARYAGQDDVPVGVPVAGRDLPELDQVVGCLLDTVVLRIRPAPELTFRQLLGQVRAVTLAAFDHADLPFERLVEQLRPNRDLAVSPLYQVMFNLVDDGRHPLRLDGVAASHLDGVGLAETKADLSLTAGQGPDGIHLHLSYRSDLFDRATVGDLLDRYRYLVAAAVAAPDVPLADLPPGGVDPPEPELPELPEPDGPTLIARIDAVARRDPGAPALVSAGLVISYGTLVARANRLAHALARRGIGRGDRVAITIDRSVAMVVAALGILKAGAAYVALDPGHPPARRAAIIARAAPRLVLTDGPAGDGGPDLAALDGPDLPDTDPAAPIARHDHAYVVFTSGSTGVPKGVLAHHGGVANYLGYLTDRYRLGPGDTVLQIAGLAFDASVRDLFGPLTVGAKVVLLDPADAKEPAAMLDLVRRHRVTCLLSVVPTLLRAMTAAATPPALPSLPAPPAGSSVRLVLCSGERLHQRDVTAARALFGPDTTVVNQYGPTECTMTSTFHVADGDGPDHELPAGRPIPGMRVYVLDPRGRPVPPGVPGEVYLAGAGVAAGYLDDPEQTAQRFRPDPFTRTVGDGPAPRMYRTGDRGRLRVDGTLVFLGRFDDQIKIRGIRVEPAEAEATLRAAPGVTQAAVVARPDPRTDLPRLVAYHVGGDLDAVRAFLRRRLPEHLVPSAFVPLDRLPRTPNGKVDRAALPEPPAPAAPAGGHLAPATGTQRRIAGAFAQVLKLARVGATDNFFDLGGDSYAAVSVTRLVGSGMRVLDLFRAPTVAALADLLDGVTGASGPRLLVALRAPRAATRTLVCVPYAGGSPVSFHHLAEELGETCTVYGVALPGHEVGRPDEAAQPFDEVTEAVAAEIHASVAGPVSLYGHCSGSAFAVEIARRLEAMGHRVDVVYAAAAFPNTRLPIRGVRRFSLDRFSSDRTYHTFFRAMGGFGDDLSKDEVRLIIRNLRHDSMSAEDYYTRTFDDPDRARLAAPIVCLVGDRDPLTEYHAERYREWSAYSGSVRLAVVERAGHYFLRHRAATVAAIVRADPPVAGDAAGEPGARPGLGVFAAVAASQFGSLLGSGLTAFALGVWTFATTGSVSLLGLIAVCALLPSIVISPVAGAVVDRVDRRVVMLLGDLGAGLGTLTLAGLIWAGQLRIWVLLAVLSWSSVCGAFQRPAYLSAIPQLIPKRYLARANGLAMSADAGSQVLAPLVAGALVAVIGLPGVIGIDVATFLVSVVTLLAVRFPNRMPWRRREPLATEIAGGWRFLLRHRAMLTLLLQAALCNLLLSAVTVLVTPLVLRGDGGSPALGIVMAAGGVGALAGGLAMAVWGGPRRLLVGILNFALVGGFFIALMGAGTSPVPMAVGMFGFWATLAVSNGCYTVLVQVKVPHHMHGRVFALNQMVALSTMPVGYLLAGPLADRVFEPLMSRTGALAGSVGAVLGTGPGRGIALLMVVLGVLTVVVNLAGYAMPRLRRIEREIPDADADLALASDPTRVRYM